MGRKSAALARSERIHPPEPPPEFAEEAEDLDTPEAEVEEAADVAVTDNVGEQSIEINVESLIAEVEAESQHNKLPDAQCARHKLEDYLERKRIARELEDFEDFVVGD
jgi:hypothetical protein